MQRRLLTGHTDMRLDIYHHMVYDDNCHELDIKQYLNSIIQKLNQMSEAGEEIKQALTDAKAKVAKVADDVARLHAKIDALGANPTAEEVAEIKEMSADLNSSLQAVDDSTPEE